MAHRQARPARVTSIGSALEPISGARTGWIVDTGPNGEPRVDYQGNRAGPLAARTIVEIPASPPGERRPALLIFDSNDPRQPVVVGLLRRSASADIEARLPGRPVAQVDGRRVVLEGTDEVVLRCGKASITLRRNGRVVIRGAQIESRAAGANKVRGGSVQIN
jgi:uncharacterized protein DUF6484